MNIGEASATEVADYPDEVILAVVELNARARKALGAGLVLPSVWMMRREEILAARRRKTR